MQLKESRCGLFWLLTACTVLTPGWARSADVGQVVCLTTHPTEGFRQPGAIGSLMLRELGRQAVLIAARDELGAATRDQTLFEPFGDGELVVDVTTAALQLADNTTLTMKLGVGTPARPVGEAVITIPHRLVRSQDLADFVTRLEAASRTELVELLKKAGVKDQRPKPDPNAVRDMGRAEVLLSTSTDCFSMIRAARLGHAAATLDPGATRPLSVLIRAYALLGMESDYLWSSADRVFHARALLYAERWLRRDPNSVDAMEHRAFARALAGLHLPALADVDAIRKQAPVPRPAPAPGQSPLRPTWMALVEPLCRYDTARLVAAMREAGEEDPLPSLLCFRSVRFTDSPSAVIGYGQAALQLNAGAMSIVDRLAEVGGVSSGHVMTEGAPRMMAALSYSGLSAAGDLPKPARALMGQRFERLLDPGTVARIIQSLRSAAATDRSEPSWGAVAGLMEEVHFVQCLRRAEFLGRKLSVDASQYIVSIKPLCGQHRYWNYILGQQDRKTMSALIEKMPALDTDYQHDPLRVEIHKLPSPETKTVWGRGDFHLDLTADSIEIRLYKYRQSTQPYTLLMARVAAQVSPDMPGALAALIRLQPETVPGGLDAAEKRLGSHPTVGAALIRHHLARKDDESAIRVIDRYVQVAPDYWAFKELAQVYDRRGDEPMWLASMKRVLDAPDYSLDHANANNQIAYRYMKRKDFVEAEPYAEAAARSYAEWALGTLIECKQGLGKFDEAEKLVIAKATRYRRHDEWLKWCVRTGKGDARAAAEAYEDEDRRLAALDDPASLANRLTYRWRTGRRLEGAKLVQAHVLATGEGYAGLLAAVAFAEAGDAAARDQMLDAVSNKGKDLIVNKRVRTELAALAQAWAEALKQNGPPVTRERVLQIAEIAPQNERYNTYYFGAAILKQAGRADDANRLLAMCVLSPTPVDLRSSVADYAAAELRAAGIDANDDAALERVAAGQAGK